jgi:hypothetical protein
VLRALPGETLDVRLTNHLAVPVSLNVGLLGPATAKDLGIRVGSNNATVAAPGQAVTYRYVADRELGAARITSFGHLVDAAGKPADPAQEGLYGAVVVEPAGSSFASATAPATTLTLADGTKVQEGVLLYHTADSLFDASAMTYHASVEGTVAVNYRTEPLAARAGGTLGRQGCDLDTGSCTLGLAQLDARNPLVALALAGAPPETPVLPATQGQPVVLRVIGGAGDQVQVHALSGHWWASKPDAPGCRTLAPTCRSPLVSADTLGPGDAHNDWIPAAGPAGPGDYLWQDQRLPFRDAGAWGVLRVI